MRLFNLFEAAVEYDDDDPDGYQAGYVRAAPQLGAPMLGATV